MQHGRNQPQERNVVPHMQATEPNALGPIGVVSTVSDEISSPLFPTAKVEAQTTSDGGYILSSSIPLQPYEANVVAYLRRWAKEAPFRTFIAERGEDGAWHTLNYGHASRLADSIAQSFIVRGLGPERPIMVLSGNSIAHALLLLGGFTAGVPLVPISVSYSLLSCDHAKLKAIFEEVKPALVYVEDGPMFTRALKSLDLSGVEVVVKSGAVEGIATTSFSDLTDIFPTQQVEKTLAAINSATVAKILYSSGSTGQPKGV